MLTKCVKREWNRPRPCGGTVEVLGNAYPRGIRKAHGLIGYMPQTPALYEELSVEQNLGFFARMQGMPRRDLPGRILEGSDSARSAMYAKNAEMLLARAFISMSPSVDALALEPELEYLYGSKDADMLDSMAPALIAFFTFFFVFPLTCVSFLRERNSGTLERLAVSRATASDITFGYMTGFGIFAFLQAAITTAFIVFVLGVQVAGGMVRVFLITFLTAIVAVNLGIFCSTFARNELQAMQFIPIVVIPQALLCGLIMPVRDMPEWLAAVANVLPMTFAVNASTDVMIRGFGWEGIWLPSLAIAAWAVGALAVATFSMKLREE